MIFSKKKKVLSAVLSLAMIGTMVASVPFTASADDTTPAPAPAPAVGVSYSTQIQSIGWQTAVADGALSGTVGQAKRLEAIKINLTNAPKGASITYKTQVQTFGWQAAVSDGNVSGTVGKAKRLEAIKIALKGMPGYSVKYQVQCQTYGWMDAVSTESDTAIDSAALAGTVGKAKRLEAIKISIVKDGTPTTTAPKVSKVAATSAKTIDVTFDSAVSDTSKISATVKLNSTAVTVTPTWNSDKTVLTLTKSSNFGSSSYTVDVMNDTTDLGSSTVSFTEQKVAKIDITSTKMAVTYAANTYTGYINYKVYDQYGVDITNTSLGNEITVNCAAGQAGTKKNGLYTITSAQNFSMYSSVVVSAYDTNSGANANKTLTVNSTFGTLGSITLGTTLKDADGKDTTLASTTSAVAYIPFTATDVSGNPTTDYTLITNGIINADSTGSTYQLTSSASTYVNATVIKDPSDSSKAMIQVATTGTKVSIDTPVIITAMLKTGGGNSQMNFTLKKAATLTSFSMSSPDSTVNVGSTVYIPFTAQDQDGNEITDGETIYEAANSADSSVKVLSITQSGGTSAGIVKGADGKAYLQFVAPTSGTVATTASIYASTTGGKYSNISFTVEPASKADSFTVSSSNYVKDMAIGSVQKLGVGVGGNDGISVLDNYSSNYGSIQSATSQYAVVAYSNDTSKVVVNAQHNYTYGSNYIELDAMSTAGSATVTFMLVPVALVKSNAVDFSTLASNSQVIDTQSVTFTVVNNKDVVSYAIDTVPKLYAYPTHGADAYGITSSVGTTPGQRVAYAATPLVYGKTSSGDRVLLPNTINGTPVLSSVSASNADFTARCASVDGSYDSNNTPKIYVFGNDISAESKTSSTGTLTAIIKALDGTTKTATAALTSSSDEPVATTVAFSSDVTTANAGADSTIGNVSLPVSDLNKGNPIVHVVQNSTVGGVQWGDFYFYATDQYAWAASPVSVYVSNETTATGSTALPTLYYNPSTGCLSDVSASGSAYKAFSSTQAGDTVTLTAVAANGITSTVTLTVKADVTPSTGFQTSYDASTANTADVLGFVGTSLSSATIVDGSTPPKTIATAAIVNGFIGITSVAPGTGNIVVNDANSHSATINITVNQDGSIKINTITPDFTFTSSTDSSVANVPAVLGLTGTSVYSSNTAIATAAITNGKIAITSVAAGTTTIIVSDGTNTAIIGVTVSKTGAITIGTITPYTATFTPTPSPVTNATLGLTASSAISNNTAIATVAVTSTGITITPVAQGSTTITVYSATGTSATVNVTVSATGAVTATVADTIAPAYASAAVSADDKTVTLTFTEAGSSAITSSLTAAQLKAAVTVANDANTFNPLGTSDTVTINGKTLVIVFNTALTGANNEIKVAAGAVKDDAGNQSAAFTTNKLTLN